MPNPEIAPTWEIAVCAFGCGVTNIGGGMLHLSGCPGARVAHHCDFIAVVPESRAIEAEKKLAELQEYLEGTEPRWSIDRLTEAEKKLDSTGEALEHALTRAEIAEEKLAEVERDPEGVIKAVQHEWKQETKELRRQLAEAKEALRGLYDMLPRYSCKADAPDGCPVCVAHVILEPDISATNPDKDLDVDH